MSNRPDENEDSNGSSNLAWFLTGAIIGAAVSILYAPQSGKDTRQFLSDKVQRSKEAVTDTSDSIVQVSRDMFDRGRKLVEDAADLFERGRKLVRG